VLDRDTQRPDAVRSAYTTNVEKFTFFTDDDLHPFVERVKE